MIPKPPDEGDRFIRLEQRVADQQADIDESRMARKEFIPVILNNQRELADLRTSMGRIATAVESMSDKITPILTERALVLKAFKWWGGVAMGVIITLGEEYLRRIAFH